jgi:hypothetical protein
VIEICYTAGLRHISSDETWKPFHQKGRQNLDGNVCAFVGMFRTIYRPQAAVPKQLDYLAAAKLLAQQWILRAA